MSSFPTFQRYALGLVLVASTAVSLGAQNTPTDSLYRRAKRLVAEGNGVAGRALIDSLLRSATEGTPAFGNALYWRGALAETAADAERDYRRVIVEYPLSSYADDALLAMADLESARGDRAGALQHLQRFVREHPVNSPARGTAALSAARLAFEQRDTRAGCSMVSAARASTPAANVETRNQIDYLGTRCAGVDVAVAAPVPVRVPAPTKQAVPAPTRQTPAPAPKTDTGVAAPKVVTQAAAAVNPPAPVPTAPVATSPVAAAPKVAAATTPVPAPVKKGSYTIQLAAYNTRVEAERLVTKLKSKGVHARISGEAKPFRVRLDFYPTRQAAQEEVATLKARGIIGFVATETPPPSATP